MSKLWSEYAAIPLRVVLALIFVVHGARTLFGVFGGGGIVTTGQELAGYGLVPGELWAVASGLLGLLGGTALLLGMLTRWVAGALAIEMVVSLLFINLRAGFFAPSGGVEFPLMVLAALLSLILSGPQHWAADEQLADWTGAARSRERKAHA